MSYRYTTYTCRHTTIYFCCHWLVERCQGVELLATIVGQSSEIVFFHFFRFSSQVGAFKPPWDSTLRIEYSPPSQGQYATCPRYHGVRSTFASVPITLKVCLSLLETKRATLIVWRLQERRSPQMFSPVFISRFAKFAINATGQQPVLGAIISSFCCKYTKNNDKSSHFVIIFLHYFLPPGITRPFLCRYYSYPIPANPTEVPLLL